MDELRNDTAAGSDAAATDAWLRGGGLLVAASERAARSVRTAFHRARRAEGLTAWPAPEVRDWNSFVREVWQQSSRDERMVLSAAQEQALWFEILGASGQGSALLEGPRQRLAALAIQAHALLCGYAPRYLRPGARSGWQQDAAAFSEWLAAFDEKCSSLSAISSARIPLELAAAWEAERADRPPLLLAAFDRLTPVQHKVFDAWGDWKHAARGPAAAEIRFYEALDAQSELDACALWCRERLRENPATRLVVIAQNLARNRGEIERTFLRHTGTDHTAQQFELSLGVPLSSVALPRGAHLILRWLSGALEESEIDWLFSTGQTITDDAERFALTGLMRALRRGNRQRMRWELDTFLAQRTGVEMPRNWAERMLAAKRRLREGARGERAPLEWSELAPELLRMAGWPGAGPLASAEFQALRRWNQALDECASLGFDGRRMSWDGFLVALRRVLDETLFAPESHDAPIQIAGPAESAGLTADAIWFLGASEDAWPASSSMHALLPVEVQREAAMPHASAQLDWELAQAVTARVIASAPTVHFSYARQNDAVEARASRLVTAVAGFPQPLPREVAVEIAPITVLFRDASHVPLRAGDAAGGATILSSQSQCPFKAFATARLDAHGWEAAQPGLTAAQRGSLLHAVMHSVWGGAATGGIRSHAELAAIADLPAFVEDHVRRALADGLPAAAREQMAEGYLDLEAVRLVNLVTEWLDFERCRVEFSVARTELDVTRCIAGLNLRLRLDRIDRLRDGSLLVIDYKTGFVSPKLWELPRPEDVQLPLYAGFGVDEELRTEIAKELGGAESETGDGQAAALGGLVFARLRAGDLGFAGRVGDARATLLESLGGSTDLVKKRLEAEDLIDWRDYIERMARDFLEGRAEVDPRDFPKTCERCDLQVLCRVHENRAAAGELDGEEGGDE